MYHIEASSIKDLIDDYQEVRCPGRARLLFVRAVLNKTVVRALGLRCRPQDSVIINLDTGTLSVRTSFIRDPLVTGKLVLPVTSNEVVDMSYCIGSSVSSIIKEYSHATCPPGRRAKLVLHNVVLRPDAVNFLGLQEDRYAEATINLDAGEFTVRSYDSDLPPRTCTLEMFLTDNF